MSFTSKRLYILLHVLCWAILFFIPFLGWRIIHEPLLIKHTIQVALLIIFFYANIYFLIPRLLFQKRLGAYIIIILLIVLLIVVGNVVYDSFFMEGMPAREVNPALDLRKRPRFAFRFLPSILITLFFFGISTSLKIFSEYLEKEKHQKEIEHEKLNSELSFLKSQINPHFLFNTLNNIYSLATIKSPNTDKAIMMLSDLMRYMLEDTNGNKVELSKEIEYLQTYLELQKLRLHESVAVRFTTSGDFIGKQIEPLLLISFIENAFKHGVSYSEPSYIKIDLKVDGNKFKLTVDNSIPSLKVERDETSGIGLNNVKKRLNLIYPDKHRLNIDQTEFNFSVHLEIEL